jgi:hypothetical protein
MKFDVGDIISIGGTFDSSLSALTTTSALATASALSLAFTQKEFYIPNTDLLTSELEGRKDEISADVDCRSKSLCVMRYKTHGGSALVSRPSYANGQSDAPRRTDLSELINIVFNPMIGDENLVPCKGCNNCGNPGLTTRSALTHTTK